MYPLWEENGLYVATIVTLKDHIRSANYTRAPGPSKKYLKSSTKWLQRRQHMPASQ